MGRSRSSRRNLFLWILSLLIVSSMLCSYTVMLSPSRQPRPLATPTNVIVWPTWTPQPSATPSGVSPTTPEPPLRQPPVTATTSS